LTTLGEKNKRAKCTVPALPNGSVERRARGLVVLFNCREHYTLYGAVSSICVVDERWSHPTPACTRPGCAPLAAPRNGRVVQVLGDAVVRLTCNPGYALDGGSDLVYCDGKDWNSTVVPPCKREWPDHRASNAVWAHRL
jgi:hypothetical protein